MGRCDDGSDECFDSPTLPQAAAVKGIGRMVAIYPIKIHVSLKEKEIGNRATFSFSRTCNVPRLVLKLPARKIALLNVKFLVAEDDTAFEDLLLGLPVLHHLRIDTRTLLKQKWSSLDGTD